jgi:hypothetical protein
MKQLLKKCQDPIWFSDNVLGGVEYHGHTIWDKQIEVMQSVRDNPFTAVRSGHGVGKSHVSARTVLWFLTAFRPSKVITTAPTWNQVINVLWAEINRIHRKSKMPIGGELLTNKLTITDEHFAIGFSTNEADKFQGHHSPNILVVFDEAPGVSDDIWEASNGLLTSPNSRFLAIGNPTRPAGMFYDAFKNPKYNKIVISCEDSPNVKEGKNVIPGLVTREWIKQMEDEWGRTSPIFKSRVLGEFPVEGEDTLIPLSWVERAIEKTINPKDESPIVMGIDVARFGTDSTVFIIYQGGKILHVEGYIGKALTKTAGRAIQLYSEYNCVKIGVDDIGVGGGVFDILDEKGLSVIGVNFGATPSDQERFDNLKTEIFWNLRERFEKNEIDIPDNSKLLYELPSLMYEVTSRGKLRIVSKDKMKKLGMSSPDYADALAIADYTSYAGRVGILDFYQEELNEQTQQLPRLLNQTDNQQGFSTFIRPIE